MMLLTRFPVFTLAVLSLFPYASWGNSEHEKAVAACAILKQQIPHVVHFPGMCPAYFLETFLKITFNQELRNICKI